MAYREVDMWEILEVLRRLHRGEPSAAIERATSRTRKTIRRYKRSGGGRRDWNAVSVLPRTASTTSVRLVRTCP